MRTQRDHPTTLAEVLEVVEGSQLPATRRRDLASAIRRICILAGVSPIAVKTEASALRRIVADIRPAAHGLTRKSWSNLRSAFAAALALASVIDALPRGNARAHGGKRASRAFGDFVTTQREKLRLTGKRPRRQARS